MQSPDSTAGYSTQSPRHSSTNSPLLSTRAFAVLMAVAGAIAAIALLH